MIDNWTRIAGRLSHYFMQMMPLVWLYDFLLKKKYLLLFSFSIILCFEKNKWRFYTQGPTLGTSGKSNFALKELIGLPNVLFNCGRRNDFEHNSCQVKECLLGSSTQLWFKSIVASSTSAKSPRGQALKLGSQSLFSQSMFIMLKTTDLGVRDKMFQNDPQNQHNLTEMCAKELEISKQRLRCCQLGNRVQEGYLFQKLIQ